MTTRIKGEMEIDHERGVIYFHSNTGETLLRICRLPTPIPSGTMLDVIHLHGQNWTGSGMPRRTVTPLDDVGLKEKLMRGIPDDEETWRGNAPMLVHVYPQRKSAWLSYNLQGGGQVSMEIGIDTAEGLIRDMNMEKVEDDPTA